tara:strand:- start:115981 stop:117153 length:1173 start_codon:yes stop_codon:yes gene_type:complete
VPAVSILIATYRRCGLLQRAIDSVLKQDFDDFELVIVDDCSPDATPEIVEANAALDSRIRYIRLPENVGSKLGDREIFRRFVAEWAQGEFFIYLCDDDYWVPRDLLSRSVAVMREHPSVVQVMGAQVQIYPDPIQKIPVMPEYWHYEWVPGINNALLMKGIFPEGLIERNRFLELQSQDPVTRNVLTGATVFRKSAFEKAGVLASRKGSSWQQGYELTTGVATQGDAYYFDEPSIAAGVDINSASFRGTQLGHLQDCLKSISIAFSKPTRLASAPDRLALRYYERKMKHAIIFTYVRNKVGFHLGWFGDAMLPDIQRIFKPEISGFRFFWITLMHRIPLSPENRRFLKIASVPPRLMRRFVEEESERYGVTRWHRELSKWPGPAVEENTP